MYLILKCPRCGAPDKFQPMMGWAVCMACKTPAEFTREFALAVDLPTAERVSQLEAAERDLGTLRAVFDELR